MKFAALTAVVAGAAIVSAAPLRVVVVSGGVVPEKAPIEVARFGLPVAHIESTLIEEPNHHHHAHAAPPDFLARPPTRPAAPMMGMRKGGCGGRRGGRFRTQAITISNAFRKALGWPLIETEDQPRHPFVHMHKGPGHHGPYPAAVDNKMHKLIQDMHIEPAFGSFMESVPGTNNGWVTIANHGETVEHFRSGKMNHRYRSQTANGQSFTDRLTYSLMNLGPWEGRAVAFVLGCGIGVLLRMIWVLFVVALRAVKGSNAPPQYEAVQSSDDVDFYDAHHHGATAQPLAETAKPTAAEEKAALELNATLLEGLRQAGF